MYENVFDWKPFQRVSEIDPYSPYSPYSGFRPTKIGQDVDLWDPPSILFNSVV